MLSVVQQGKRVVMIVGIIDKTIIGVHNSFSTARVPACGINITSGVVSFSCLLVMPPCSNQWQLPHYSLQGLFLIAPIRRVES